MVLLYVYYSDIGLPVYKFLDTIIFPKDKIVNLAYEYILEQGEGKIIGNNFMKHYILA